jgi:hypothetical protein
MDAMSPAPAPLGAPAYLARITRRDGPAIEEAMAGATLIDDGARLDGAVIEASYAFDAPPLLKRLRDDGVHRIIDPQSLRFTGERYLETESLRRLPYAPDHPITVDNFDALAARQLAHRSMLYAQERGSDLYLAPGVPLYDADLDRWIKHNDALLSAACAVNGGAEVERKPLLAQIAPGAKALADPKPLIERLLDRPIDGVYVQALRLNPVSDSLEKLARFVQFTAAIRDAGFPVIVGRVGAFGLVLQAIGIPVFDSGLGLAEGHDLATLNRRVTERERQRRAESGGGGPPGRVYLEPLKTTLPAKVARIIVTSETLRHHFACTLGCCRFRALEELPERARSHYLFARRTEVDAMRKLSVAAMRLHQIETQLRSARDLGAVVRRALPDAGLSDLGHIDRWLGLLAREQQLALAS